MSASLFISSSRVDGSSLIFYLGVQGSPVESFNLELKDSSGHLDLAKAGIAWPKDWFSDGNYKSGVLALSGFSLSPIATGNLLGLTLPVIDAPASQPLALSWSAKLNYPIVQVAGGLVVVAENAATSTLVYQAKASDAGTKLSYSLSGTDAAKFTIDAVGAVRLKAATDYETLQSYAITVHSSDGKLSDSQAVTVAVTDVNEAPLLTSPGSASVAENAATSTLVYQAIATDVDAGAKLTYSLSGTDAGQFTIDAAGAVRLNAAADYETQPSYAITVKASDGALSASQAVKVTVTDVNEAPTASNRKVSLNEDRTGKFALANFGFSDVDAGDSLQSVKITMLEAKGALKLNGADVTLNQVISAADIVAGKLAYTPAANGNGAAYASFGFKVSDGTAMSANAYQMTLNVTAVNDAPTASHRSVTFNEDTTRKFAVADFGFKDVDSGNSLQSVKITTLEVKGSLKLSGADVTLNQVIKAADIAAGKLAYTPLADGNGVAYANFGFKVSDGTAMSASAYQMMLNVKAVRDDLTLTGTSGADTLKGDTIDAGSYDKLSSLAGNDNLDGGAGNDTLIGGAGADQLTGGTGNDIFRFTALADFGLDATARDVIADFKRGQDKIDLSAIDANLAKTGDQAFTWVTKFSATAGQVRFAADGNGNGIVYLNTDKDVAAEHEILLTGVTTLSALDFNL